MDNPEKLATLGNRQTSGESASLDEGTESAEVATSVTLGTQDEDKQNKSITQYVNYNF